MAIWSICSVAYPELSNIIRGWPQSLIQMGLSAKYINNHADFYYVIEAFEK